MKYRLLTCWSLTLLLSVMLSCSQSEGRRATPPPAPKARDSVARNDPAADSSLLDTAGYNARLLYLAHGRRTARWPVKTDYPLPGAILPFKRIVAYYGNFYSAGMGILGQLPPDEMLEKLKGECRKWEAADTATPVLPAIHYIAVTAQHNPGPGHKYRARMPFSQIDKAIELTKKVNGIVFIDVQVGHSTLQEELPPLEPYLKRPEVHLGIDPEYSMKHGEVPCSKIGTMDAADINYASSFLAGIVRKYHIPPRILVVHRFIKEMVTNYKQIQTHPEVQIVMDMDGFGFPGKKKDSYTTAETNEPVQFTGFKLFYRNDTLTRGFRTMMTPAEVIQLYPAPIYIQYQ